MARPAPHSRRDTKRRIVRPPTAAAERFIVLYEDNHCLAVSKPAGVLTAPDRTGDPSMLDLARRYLKEKYAKPGNVYLGLVHRLDRPVSGVLLLARTSKAAGRLARQFRERTVSKVYLAWVSGRVPAREGRLSDALTKARERNVARVAPGSSAGAQAAELDYRVLERARSATLLEIRPRTGRSHQIRVQLASRGMPIVGDVKYGGRAMQPGRIALHAIELTFEHPVLRTPVTVRAEPPRDWQGGRGPGSV